VPREHRQDEPRQEKTAAPPRPALTRANVVPMPMPSPNKKKEDESVSVVRRKGVK
jgi:hypothetical protein